MSDCHAQKGPGFASPAEAMRAPREEIVYVACLHTGTGIDEPDFLAVVDVNPESDRYSQIIHRTPMPNVGDELHHYGWQTCSSGHDCCGLERRHLVVPGFHSSRIHVVDVGNDPRRPEIVKVIEPEEVIRKTGYTRPHTVHCMPGNIITISMLGDAEGNLPGGFMVLDATTFEVLGRWDRAKGDQQMMYDFWCQPRQKTIEVEPKEVEGWPFPVPGLCTDQLISMDDRYLYFSNWLHGDIRQYDITEPARPRLNSQVWCGGLLNPVALAGRKLDGGPQMLQMSMDGRRLYVTNSLYSSWDNQFYSGMSSWMLKVDIGEDGTMRLDPSFYVDFSPARGHEVHLPGGDVTTEIFA